MVDRLFCTTPECGGHRVSTHLFCLDCTITLPKDLQIKIRNLRKQMEATCSQVDWVRSRDELDRAMETARRIIVLKKQRAAGPTEYSEIRGRV